MFDSFSLPALVALFAASAGVIWFAGIRLSKATDVLSDRLGLGEALGGLTFLAIATNLPEIAITSSAALSGDLSIATGNILGGIAIQTVVLAVLDFYCTGPDGPLTTRAASLVLVVEGGLVVAVLAVVLMGTELPSSLIIGRVPPASLLIVLFWIAGVLLVARARHGLPWQPRRRPPRKRARTSSEAMGSAARAGLVFGVAAVLTLLAGITIEQSGEVIAGDIGLEGAVFGATILAAATSLPEVSTGIASVKLGDYELAVSDIFGGNAFLPVLFLVAALLSGQAVLSDAAATDVYLTALAILLTVVYMAGLLFRSPHRVWRLGLDSALVVVLYAVGIAGLVAVTR
jgi:cation:H+ antiporter